MDRNIETFKRVMNTVDGRDFIYNFFLEHCGFDFSLGVNGSKRGEYEQGIIKPAIDIFNLMVYHCPDKLKLMLTEQEQRSQINGRNS